MTFDAPPGFMTPAQAAKAWSTRAHRVARRTVIAWCTRGLIPGVRKVPVGRRAGSAKRTTFGYVIPRSAPCPVVIRGRPIGSGGPHPRKKRTAADWAEMAKRAAVQAVARALRVGDLIRPTCCSVCGHEAAIEAHHHKGYARKNRLEVVWLCVPCHRAAHGGTQP